MCQARTAILLIYWCCVPVGISVHSDAQPTLLSQHPWVSDLPSQLLAWTGSASTVFVLTTPAAAESARDTCREELHQKENPRQWFYLPSCTIAGVKIHYSLYTIREVLRMIIPHISCCLLPSALLSPVVLETALLRYHPAQPRDSVDWQVHHAEP